MYFPIQNDAPFSGGHFWADFVFMRKLYKLDWTPIGASPLISGYRTDRRQMWSLGCLMMIRWA